MYDYHNLHNFIWFLLVGGLAGWLASVLVQGGGMGIIIDILVGTAGAYIGGWMVEAFGISVGGFWGALFMWVLGAVVLLVIVRAIVGQGGKRKK